MLWDSIILDAALEKQLLSQAILNFTQRLERPNATCFRCMVTLVGNLGSSGCRGLGIPLGTGPVSSITRERCLH